MKTFNGYKCDKCKAEYSAPKEEDILGKDCYLCEGGTIIKNDRIIKECKTISEKK